MDSFYRALLWNGSSICHVAIIFHYNISLCQPPELERCSETVSSVSIKTSTVIGEFCIIRSPAQLARPLLKHRSPH